MLGNNQRDLLQDIHVNDKINKHSIMGPLIIKFLNWMVIGSNIQQFGLLVRTTESETVQLAVEPLNHKHLF